jgi:F-type H+-transporting ATPase subunit c
MKTLYFLALAAVALLLTASPVLAQTTSGVSGFGVGFGAGVGAGVTIIGAGIGFGRIGAAALESMSRQPEVAGRIQTAMIVIAALLEGATFVALIVCILVANTLGTGLTF